MPATASRKASHTRLSKYRGSGRKSSRKAYPKNSRKKSNRKRARMYRGTSIRFISDDNLGKDKSDNDLKELIERMTDENRIEYLINIHRVILNHLNKKKEILMEFASLMAPFERVRRKLLEVITRTDLANFGARKNIQIEKTKKKEMLDALVKHIEPPPESSDPELSTTSST